MIDSVAETLNRARFYQKVARASRLSETLRSRARCAGLRNLTSTATTGKIRRYAFPPGVLSRPRSFHPGNRSRCLSSYHTARTAERAILRTRIQRRQQTYAYHQKPQWSRISYYVRRSERQSPVTSNFARGAG